MSVILKQKQWTKDIVAIFSCNSVAKLINLRLMSYIVIVNLYSILQVFLLLHKMFFLEYCYNTKTVELDSLHYLDLHIIGFLLLKLVNGIYINFL